MFCLRDLSENHLHGLQERERDAYSEVMRKCTGSAKSATLLLLLLPLPAVAFSADFLLLTTRDSCPAVTAMASCLFAAVYRACRVPGTGGGGG